MPKPPAQAVLVLTPSTLLFSLVQDIVIPAQVVRDFVPQRAADLFANLLASAPAFLLERRVVEHDPIRERCDIEVTTLNAWHPSILAKRALHVALLGHERDIIKLCDHFLGDFAYRDLCKSPFLLCISNFGYKTAPAPPLTLQINIVASAVFRSKFEMLVDESDFCRGPYSILQALLKLRKCHTRIG